MTRHLEGRQRRHNSHVFRDVIVILVVFGLFAAAALTLKPNSDHAWSEALKTPSGSTAGASLEGGRGQ